MRREKREGLVSPIVAKARRGVLLVEGIHGQQLDGADTKIAQIWYLVDQPGVGAALAWRHTRVWMPSEPADMHLVDNRLGERPTKGCIPLPVIPGRVDNHTP